MIRKRPLNSRWIPDINQLLWYYEVTPWPAENTERHRKHNDGFYFFSNEPHLYTFTLPFFPPQVVLFCFIFLRFNLVRHDIHKQYANIFSVVEKNGRKKHASFCYKSSVLVFLFYRKIFITDFFSSIEVYSETLTKGRQSNKWGGRFLSFFFFYYHFDLCFDEFKNN